MDTSFENALTKFQASLTEGQRRDFAPCTLEDVQTAINEIQVRLGSQRQLRGMKRITKFIEAMTQLGQAIAGFPNIGNAVAFVWGPIKFVLLAASTCVEALEGLLATYAEIGEILPGLTEFRSLLEQHPRLKVHLANYYCDILDFHRNAIDVFSRPAWKTVFHSSWKLFRTRYGVILSNLKRHRELISDEKLTIAISEVQDSREFVEEKLEALSNQMKQLQLKEKTQATLELGAQRRQRLEFVLDKFDVAGRQRQRALREPYRHHSGDWIFNHRLFKEWADLKIARNSTLYLNGIPGAGKTILTSRVVERLKQLKSDNSAQGHDFSVVYFYFNYMQPDKRTLTGLLLSLLTQLIHQDDVLLEQTYQRCLAINQQNIQSSNAILDLASIALKSQRLCFVILDGLDECIGDSSTDPAKEQKQVIDWFDDLMTDLGSEELRTFESCLRLFISGQRNGVLEERLGSYPSIQLETTPSHTQDIESYAKQRSMSIRKKFNISPEVERDLVNRVTSGAKGMFLYAKIVLSNLLRQASEDHFKQELKAENFPKGLNEAYERVVVGVFENPIEPERLTAKAILGLVICAERSLMWKEIQSRFFIDTDTETADADRRLQDSCKHLCGSLVEVERSQMAKPVPDDAVSSQIAELGPDDVVDLVHHTARVYLVQSRRLCIARENATMALFCARYLTSLPFTLGLNGGEIEKHGRMGYYAFQDYAAAFWWKHAFRMINTATDIDKDHYNRTLQAVARAMKEYSSSGDRLPEPGGCPADVVQRLKELAEDAREWEDNFKIGSRTRAIRNKLEELLSRECSSETHCSIVKLYGPIRYKCHKPWCQSFCTGFETHKDRDQHLLEHDRPFRCPVESCLWNKIGFLSESDLGRHSERLHSTQSTIRFALPHAGKIQPRHICSAAETGDLAKVKACLAKIPIDTAPRSKGGRTPLYLAAEQGHVHICRYLLEHGADVNFRNNRNQKRTALHAAALANDAELTELLLSQRGLLLQPKDSDKFTPAGSAAKNGCNMALSIFISMGLASLPGQDGTGNTCLNIAMGSGNLKTAELLINDTSLDLNTSYGDRIHSGLPLHIASRTGLVEIAKLLLSSGRVNVNKADDSGRRALHHACENGRDSIVELLLPVIDDHDARDASGRTPLQYAAEKGHEAIVKLLLEMGADPNSKDNDGRTPLLLTDEKKYASVVKLLREKGGTVPETAVEPLLGTRPTRILLGYWNKSDQPNPKDRHAVYGILGQNDMFRVKLVRETRDGRFVDGNFPIGATALWIPYEEVEFEDHLKGLPRAEIKEYCRVRQYQMDHGENPEERVANETQAVIDSRHRVSAIAWYNGSDGRVT